MVTIKTTRYYLSVFGSIQKKLTQVSGDASKPSKDDVFQYQFDNDEEFFSHFQRLAVKTVRATLIKGKTVIGVYERKGGERDRPRPRLNSQKFKKRDG